MAELYPITEPHDRGMLDVGDGNHVYWEVVGNPGGKPAVVVHGGPGTGCTPGMRQYFDPAVYRVVLFDQRNCGRSTPRASDPATDLSTNTTRHLIADMELLRRHLGIDRWLVFGGSWGATLTFAYAEAHPESVSEIVLSAITNTRPSEIDWLYHGVGAIFPQEWERFRDGVPEDERDGNLVPVYNRLLNDPDPAVREKAAKDWADWELAVTSLEGGEPSPFWTDPELRYGLVRICAHYFANNGFLDDGVLQREAGKLAGIPGVMVHGRFDLGGPLRTAWEMSKVWPDGELVIVETGGHTSRSTGMGEQIVAATDRYARAWAGTG
ncbi:prolyl aminopeptidase [Amycolatopsis suaedae]|uniref:Proline iminopeptidase n=1 Tax=Amycolatopsis suaedae TaxID=2510978 RepID=A0A4Q7J2N2_9PSEU|nr:prolyl aminopeptidase [Amycolatopsis suaedae]RZQ60816.1 prolyl aminopeptidase [Amycolatopsis suaedae]